MRRWNVDIPSIHRWSNFLAFILHTVTSTRSSHTLIWSLKHYVINAIDGGYPDIKPPMDAIDDGYKTLCTRVTIGQCSLSTEPRISGMYRSAISRQQTNNIYSKHTTQTHTHRHTDSWSWASYSSHCDFVSECS